MYQAFESFGLIGLIIASFIGAFAFIEKWFLKNMENVQQTDIYAYEGSIGFEIHIKNGESFVEPDFESFKAKMIELKEEGYYIPERVFDLLDQIERDYVSGV